VSATTNLGAALGLVAGLGLLLVWRRLPWRRRPTLADRLAPYLSELGRDEWRGELGRDEWRGELGRDDRTVSPFPTLERLLRPYLSAGADALERMLGGTASVRKRLAQAGSPLSVHQFRIDQLVWGVSGFAGALVLSLLIQAGGRASSPFVLVMFCAAAAVAGVTARDHQLSRHVRRRESQMMAEFPAVADLLALAVAAGEGPVSALDRVAQVSSGELGRELGRAVADVRAGAGLVPALDGVAARTSLAPLARFVDGIAVAVERGTPLGDVLRAQAADVREARRRHLIELGGRKEIAMMVPVVFMILPVTIVFALYPGLIQISTIVP
jgi:tight adherence protein C